MMQNPVASPKTTAPASSSLSCFRKKVPEKTREKNAKETPKNQNFPGNRPEHNSNRKKAQCVHYFYINRLKNVLSNRSFV
jgi:hypothetical protein